MGGNVNIEGQKADAVTNGALVELDLRKFFNEFKKHSGIWKPETKIEDVASGSTSHMFDPSISKVDFIRVKPYLGDIDLQIDLQLTKKLIDSFMPDLTMGEFKFIGWKQTTNTVVTLWRYRESTNVQIDFEGVQFQGGKPIEWARFIYSSPWIDLEQGIKGVAHKYIFRALTGLTLGQFEVVGAKGKEMQLYAFSYKGLRKKLVLDRQEDGKFKWRTIPAPGAHYERDLKKIFGSLFCTDFPATESIIKDMHSYTGMLNIIRTFLNDEEKLKVADCMADLLFGSKAQKICAENAEDLWYKWKMMMLLATVLNISTARWQDMIDTYYGILQNN